MVGSGIMYNDVRTFPGQFCNILQINDERYLLANAVQELDSVQQLQKNNVTIAYHDMCTGGLSFSLKAFL